MGFFSTLFTAAPVKLTISDEREAYVSILIACISTDGNISDEEQTALYVGILTPFQLRDHARHSSTDISMRYYHAEQIIPEVRGASFEPLTDLVKKQKKRNQIG